MDAKRTGQFIAALRKEQQMTQQELAEKLGVTDKAISRWETGKGFPDITMLERIAEVLKVSISELVLGEKMTSGNTKEKTDTAIIETLQYAARQRKQIAGILLTIFGAGLLVSPIYFTSVNPNAGALITGAVLLLMGIFVLFNRREWRWGSWKLSKQTAGIWSLLSLLVTLILEILPYGAVLIFADPEKRIRRTFSYFSLTPAGYANVFPLVTALLTVVIMVLTVIMLIGNPHGVKLKNAIFICTVIACVFSVLSAAFFGMDYLSVTGVLITMFLLLSAIFRAAANRKMKE